MGRVVRLNQGKKKELEPLYVIKEKSSVTVNDEEDEILASVLDRNVEDEDDVSDEVGMHMQTEETRNPFVDDDGIVNVRDILKSVEYEDFDDDDLDGEDEDFVYDGVFEQEYEVEEFNEDDGVFKNREQRRKEAAANKRRKKKGRGFGN